MSVLPLQRDVVYGPIQSRRLGRSLGVNLLPAARKVCSFDCIYCQYGGAEPRTVVEEHSGFPEMQTVLRKVEQAVTRQSELDYLTFSGNGEPTLHPRFAEIVAEVRRLKDRLRPNVRLAVLSNSSQICRPEIREAVEQVDDSIMKLDAGDSQTLSKINRPALGVDFEEVVAGLRSMRRVVIQSMFIAGRVQNAEGEAYEAWLASIAQVRPKKVQIYSVARPVAVGGVQRVSREVLERLARAASDKTGIEVRAF